MSFYIRKSSGEKQRFDLRKFRRSLFKAGASEKVINSIITHIKKSHPKSTQEIHEIATGLLQQKAPPVADRYNLKRALMEFGPHGFPFEQFIAQLFSSQGYTTTTNTAINGFCVTHEVDVTAQKNEHHFLIECKFHNRTGLKTDVKVSLYVQARFEDIRAAWEKNPHHAKEFHQAWIVTNTKFTTEAIKYAACKKMKLIGWSYPQRNNLPQLIEKYDLFPITTLTSLSRSQKQIFLKKGLVLCKDARDYKKTLAELGLKPRAIAKIIQEAEAVCKL